MQVIVDYGLGNLRSVEGAVKRLGFDVRVSSDPKDIYAASHLILPGVGAFGDGMRNLHQRDLVGPLNEAVKVRKVPILGICLGAQLLARDSFEFGHHEGLGWIDASVVKITPSDPKLRVPHVGWNELTICKESRLLQNVPKDALFYFVHSFHIKVSEPEVVVATSPYGEEISAILEKNQIYATQFHPEKSQQHGLTLLKNFLEVS